MMKNKVLVILCVLLSAANVFAQIKEPKPMSEDWTKPYPPFQIVGNVYYVGTHDLACYLITTKQGHILINTGLASSAQQIENSVKTLGFKLSDIKILLTTQVHHDHLGAMAAIKRKTGARMMVNEKDAPEVESGGKADYAFGEGVSMFEPLKVDRVLHDREVVQLGDMQLTMLHHPGHTKGSCSFLFSVNDGQQKYRVLIANMPTIVVDKKLSQVTTYPTIGEDYAYTLKEMKNIQFDIWLASHAGQFDLHKKHQPGDAYNPKAFIDKIGYQQSLAELQKSYDAKK